MHPFAIDYRSLSLFRICLGGMVAYFLFTHLEVFDLFHSAEKAISTETVISSYGSAWKGSLNWLSDSSAYQYTLVALGFAAACCLTLGWHTRLATIVCWLIVTSFINSMPLLLSGGDFLLNALLLWGMFLPLDQRWSVDDLRCSSLSSPSGGKNGANTLVSVATAGILLQMAMMYVFTGISKCNESWFDGSALAVTLSIDHFVHPAGRWLREFPLVTNVFSRGTLVVELLFPFLLFSPWKTTRCRTVVLLTLMSLHVGIQLTMSVITFSFSALTGLTLFIPSRWWSFFPLRNLQSCLDHSGTSKKHQQQVSRQQRRSQERKEHRQKKEFWGTARSFKNVLLVTLILYTFSCNLINRFTSIDMSQRLAFVHKPAAFLAIEQKWAMFKYPPAICYEVACVGRLRNGTYVDLTRGGIKITDRTQAPRVPLPNNTKRLRNSLLMLTSTSGYKSCREDFLRYFINQWDSGVTDQEEKIIESFLTIYPKKPHILAEKNFTYADLYHLDLLSEGALVAGEREGPWVLYHENGQKMSVGNYQKGKAVGQWIFWNPDGSKSAEGTMKNGRPAGEWKHYQGDEVKIINHSQPAKPAQ